MDEKEKLEKLDKRKDDEKSVGEDLRGAPEKNKTQRPIDSTPSCEFCGRELILYKDKWICGHGCTKPALKPSEPLKGNMRWNEKTKQYEPYPKTPSEPDVLNGLPIAIDLDELMVKEPTEDNLCSNCGKLNDMCGVYLKKINLCDQCISSIMEIVFDDSKLVKMVDLEDWKAKFYEAKKSIGIPNFIIGGFEKSLKNMGKYLEDTNEK